MTSLEQYRLLGRSGLRVSPLALGTMTFGQDWGWGADATESRRIFDLYIDRGGNFVDTAVNYTDGASERLLGEFLRDKRERVVLATKFTMAREPRAARCSERTRAYFSSSFCRTPARPATHLRRFERRAPHLIRPLRAEIAENFHEM